MDVLQIRNFRDFLLLYNQISETCFKKCTNTFASREIEEDEEVCVKNCVEKHVHANHKIMEVYMEVQPIMVRRRIDEMNAAQEALEAQAKEQQETDQTPQQTA
ncbi:hypothetical protein KM043_015207 [Ampulex compressa]|nr:hypothetical protein KM043_015207 [Ampulex compressa]